MGSGRFTWGKAARKSIRWVRNARNRRVSVDDFVPLVALAKGSRGIDLGSGPHPKNFFGVENFFGVDIFPNPEKGVLAADLTLAAIPAESGSLDFLSAFDFVEHVPRWERLDGQVRFPFIELMDEIHRTLKPGGYFFSRTPAFPAPEAFRDPTHINIITEETFPKYFCGPRWASKYGFQGRFNVVRQGWSGGHLLTLLQKPTL